MLNDGTAGGATVVGLEPGQERAAKRATALAASFNVFAEQVAHLLNGQAEGKGYAPTGGDGRDLLDFVRDACGDGHALGEIVYKVVRWRRRQNPEDLLKVAAWAFLAWDQAQRHR